MKKLTIAMRKEFCRNIIDRYPNYVNFEKVDREEFISLANWDNSVEEIQKRPNPAYPNETRHLYVLVNGIWDSKSWIKSMCKQSEFVDQISAMRRAVIADIQEYVDSYGRDNCEHCSSEEHLQTDHTDPSFDEIMRDFFKKFGVPKVKKRDDRVGYELENIETEARWIAFHAANASYQTLCRSCNASKGKGRHVKRKVDA